MTEIAQALSQRIAPASVLADALSLILARVERSRLSREHKSLYEAAALRAFRYFLDGGRAWREDGMVTFPSRSEQGLYHHPGANSCDCRTKGGLVCFHRPGRLLFEAIEAWQHDCELAQEIPAAAAVAEVDELFA